MSTSPAKPVYEPSFVRFAETFTATDAAIPDYVLVQPTTGGKVEVASTAGEVLGVNLVYLEATDPQEGYTLSRLVTVANSGLLLLDTDGASTFEVGDVITINSSGQASDQGTPLAVTLNGKDLIVREVIDAPRAQVKFAV